MRAARGTLTALLLTVALLVVLPSPALAWSNGGNMGNGFGTHDWILYHAVYFSTKQGATWVNKRVALPMTDDPDMVFHDNVDHNYDRWGGEHWGNAQNKVAHYYARTVYYLKRGDKRNASKMIALLAHYYGDINEPLHTEAKYPETGALHTNYEHTVDRLTHTASMNIKWLHYDGYEHVDSAKAFTVATATKAHGSYAALVREFSRHGFNAKVRRITGTQLNRAANGLSDLIVSAQEDAAQRGLSPIVAGDAGVATDGSHLFVTGTAGIEQFDSKWHSLATTSNPTADISDLTTPQVGAGACYGGRLYVPADNTDGTSQYVLVFDAATLQRVDAFPISQTHSVTCIAIMPKQGSHGVFYLGSSADSRHLYRFDLSTHAFLGSFKLKLPPQGKIGGLGNRNNKLILTSVPSSDRGKVYTVDGHGRTRLVFASSASGHHAGIAFTSGDLQWLVGAGDGSGRVHRIHLPIK